MTIQDNAHLTFAFIPLRRRLPLRGSLSSAFGAPLLQGATQQSCKNADPSQGLLPPYRHFKRSEKSLSFLRDSRFPHICRASLCFSHLSFIPPVPYPAHFARRLPLEGGRLYVGDSNALVYDALETIFSLSFIPLVPYPARSARHLPHAGNAVKLR